MNNLLKFVLVPLVMIAIVAASADFADAKRLGGGRSFGGSKSYQNSYTKPVSPTRQSATSGTGMVNNQRSRFGGFGGFLGGMLAGSLLGSLFFGHPFAGGGFMDLIILGGLAFLLFKLFRRRSASSPQYATQGAGMSYGGAGPDPGTTSYRTGGQDQAASGWSTLGGGASAAQEPSVPVPPGFDEKEFLEGAKVAFSRLQGSWDARDLEDIAQFVSPAVLAEIREQAAQDPTPSRTEILMLNARLLEVRQEGQRTVATVFFDVFLRESPAAGSEQVREVWHFLREEGVAGDMWRLDGIQQLEG
ncbi:putative lipid-binding transport protein (Tim44 family) [Desulfobaculum xiamenense]|uniref:Putative lipid-binding transport protein (Tim44 family) n=1 Tax=Desulfobaculum xiamenense TaxID=995050 RepID=A0A846QMC9_9BACT|nr:TIM44-like domain-containing protein [Desulfobaculum xiamenense]NJB69261.1 putative lipid-binding transport protein (Tim44 family) [Desulfobaculum xiamenense]